MMIPIVSACVLGAIVLIAAVALPKHVTVSRSVLINAPPSVVFQKAKDLQSV